MRLATAKEPLAADGVKRGIVSNIFAVSFIFPSGKPQIRKKSDIAGDKLVHCLMRKYGVHSAAVEFRLIV